MTNQWFDVDRAGLSKQAEEHGKGRLIGELVQNALDEAGVTRIDIRLVLIPGQPLADLTVEDDSAEGFRDLSHAYTLFAPSGKRTSPQQRGQYNFGEKLVLAVCEAACISTTKGTVHFDPIEGRIEQPEPKRQRGSVFQGRIRLSQDEYPQVCDYLRSLLLPEHIVVTFNGDRLLPRPPLRSFEASLETLIADEHGVMRPRVRKTEISIFEPLPGEAPSLYEMGLPIVETGDRWHVNIHQKVPVNRDRNNVRPAYLQAVRVAVLNGAYDLLPEEQAASSWCKSAGADPRCADEAIKQLVTLRFGEKVASPDPSDPEAMKAFQAQGGTIVVGLSKGEWANVRRASAALPAGRICPTAKPYSLDPSATSVTIIALERWTAGMRSIAEYAKFLAWELMGVSLTVSIVHTTNNFVACYGGGRLDFNLLRLGRQWFEAGAGEEVDRLLIHEFGHQYSADHLSEEYHDALCRLGAALKQLAMQKPNSLLRFQAA